MKRRLLAGFLATATPLQPTPPSPTSLDVDNKLLDIDVDIEVDTDDDDGRRRLTTGCEQANIAERSSSPFLWTAKAVDGKLMA